KDLDREYSLYEIAIITRAGPARMLGLKDKGHLGVGADADVTIYTPNADKRAMFELPRFVIKGGEVVVEQGEIRCEVEGRSLHVVVGENRGVDPDVVSERTSFIDEVGAGSLDIVELIMELEEEFDITIPDEQAEKLKTVGEAIDYIQRHMRDRRTGRGGEGGS